MTTVLLNNRIIALKRSLRKWILKATFSSGGYWEKRYRNGGTSGDGSYNEIAEFKGRVINEFISEKSIRNLIDFGCGDGNQAGYIHVDNYIGLDVARTAIDICKKKFKNDSSKKFWIYPTEKKNKMRAEVVISFDVLFHLIETEVFERYLKDLFDMSENYVVIFSTNVNKVNSVHHIDRKFTDYIDRTFKSWKLTHKIENPFKGKKSLADFYFYEKL